MEYWSTGVLGLKRITPLLNQSSSPIFVALEKLMFACCHSLLSRLFVSILVVSVIGFTIPPGVLAQEQIIVGYDGYAGFQGPIWATKDLGLFDKYGLPGELVLIPGSARGMAGLDLWKRPIRPRLCYRTAVDLFAGRRCCRGGGRLEQVSFQR